MYSITIMNKSRKNNPRRLSQSRTAGYSYSHTKHRGYTPLFSAVALLLSAIVLGACPDGNNTGSTAVTNITITNITTTTLTLNWTNPTDSDGFQGVLISTYSTTGTLAPPQQQPTSAAMTTIADLNHLTTYFFTLTSVYTNSSKNDISPVKIARTLSRATLPIDGDGDGLVDITSLERLDSIRYNLDLSDGLFKTSATDSGVQCGTAQDMPCTGYELVFTLDFANPTHYDSGVVNAAWRPQDSSGTVVTQADADSATNAGWQPIAYADMVNGGGEILDANHTPFNTLFDGNHYTIRNLFVRRRGTGGLFGGTGSAATIRNTAVVAAALYGSDNNDAVGGLIGHNDGGTVIASYAEVAITGGTGTATDNLGGLIGSNAGGTIIASYARGTVNVGVGNAVNYLGGLVGNIVGIRTTVIIASYSSAAVTSGAGSDVIGGLIGGALSNTTIIASYATGAISGNASNDTIGGLLGENNLPIIIAASYATGDVSGDAGDDNIGGLIAFLFDSGSRINASYATGMVDGGGDSDLAGHTVRVLPSGSSSTYIVATYGFGTATAETVNDIGAPPMGVTSASDLTLTTAGTQWNSADHLTLDAWDFGTDIQPPALRYADYDGAGTEYGCGTTTGTVATIPSVVPDGMGGTIDIECGTTLLPGQGR